MSGLNFGRLADICIAISMCKSTYTSVCTVGPLLVCVQ